MTAPSSSSTSAFSRALIWALGLLVVVNGWIAWRLEPLLRETNAADLFELDARVARFDAASRVKVLVFGNSHPMHALRPASLGPALGLAADEVFNLSLPAASPFELGLLARRYRPRFPAARVALVGLDEITLAADPGFTDTRMRYHTRGDLAARWHYARGLATFDRQLAALVTWALPVGDFGRAIGDAWRADRQTLATRLVVGDVGWTELTPMAIPAWRPYRWGFPPLPERDAWNQRWRDHLKEARSPGARRVRAEQWFGRMDLVARSLVDFEQTCRQLEADGLRVQLVSSVSSAALRDTIARHFGPQDAACREAQAAYFRDAGRTPFTPPVPDEADYLDADHLNEAGAAHFAAALARGATWLKAWLEGRT